LEQPTLTFMVSIAIFGQSFQPESRIVYQEIFYFFKEQQVNLCIEKNFYQLLQKEVILTDTYPTYDSFENFPNEVDFLLSIGGDGTILRAITFTRGMNIPILGVNIGRLGFLAKIQKNEIRKSLTQVLQKEYTISNRSLLSLETEPAMSGLESLNFALNEITVSRKNTTSMITVATYLNDEYLTSYWADGLIVSTPTGSTGYSLSCGGPVLTPEVSSFVITPIAPHNLNARPLVIPDEMEITLKVSGREQEFLVSLDSRVFTFAKETTLKIKKNSFQVPMIEITPETFLKTLRSKLLWGEDKRN
jgi:NAD+ kinase